MLIPGGSFLMGDQSDPLVGDDDELPMHSVYVSGFYMGKYEVTKDLWDEVRAWGLNNGYTDLPLGSGKAADHPVHSINWYAMVKWCNARSEKDNLIPCYTVGGITFKTGVSDSVSCDCGAGGFRLPTEAEWEKSARGGLNGRRYPRGNAITHSDANFVAGGPHPAWNDGIIPYTAEVGSFEANGYGLHDMAGNVWEWCWDWSGSYSSVLQSDPRGPSVGSRRVFRGGGWDSPAWNLRCADRRDVFVPAATFDHLGFRLAREQ